MTAAQLILLIQGETESLRQTLRSDETRRKDRFLSSNPCSLTLLLWPTRRLREDKSQMTFIIMKLIIHSYLQMPLRTVYRRCWKRLSWTWLHSLDRHSSDCWTLRTSEFCVEFVQKQHVFAHQLLSGLNWIGVQDALHMPQEKKKYKGMKSGDRVGRTNQRHPSRWMIASSC